MSERFPSSSFIVTMLVIDALFLGILGSGVLPFDPSALLVGFGLFGLSPLLAYLITESRSAP
ncbi:hypothetical protein GCM10027435_20300 [Haloparvum alkalitolerans]|uniref:hypothetical protein n=1 Tax=Haloparvum alkalitolerans TaxID=1042953 RepID=UPI003CF5C595